MCIVCFIFGLLSLPVIIRVLFSSCSEQNIYIIYKGNNNCFVFGQDKACCVGIYIRNSSKILHNTFLQLFGHSG